MSCDPTASFEILLVDDEPGDRELARLALAQGQFGCRVTTAANGRDAMAILRKEPPAHRDAPTPDLVLLDLNMPQMNGREVLEAVRDDPHLAHIPVVVLTTSEHPRDIIACYALGAAGFVTKSADLNEFFRILHGIQQYWFSVVHLPSHGQRRKFGRSIG